MTFVAQWLKKKSLAKILTKPWVFFLFFCLGYITYSTSLMGDFVWDDEYQLIYTPITYSVRNIPEILVTGQLDIFYRPVLFIYLTIIHHTFGLNPLPFHFFQVLLHVGNAFMVFLLLKRFLKDGISFLLALLFLVHPMNVEGIAHISAAGDPISTFFGLIAFHLMLPVKLSLRRVILAGLVMFVALMGKETALLILCIIVMYRTIFIKNSYVQSFIFALTPVLYYSFMRFGVANTFFKQLNFIPIAQLPLDERMLNIPKIIFFYISTFFVPIQLSIAQNWIVREVNMADFILPLITITIFFGGMMGIIWRSFRYKENDFKEYIFFFLWLAGGLCLYLQFVPLDMTVGERWFYVPMIGLLGFIGVLVQRIKIFKGKILFAGILIYIIIVGFFSVRTIMRNANWIDDYTIFSHDIQVTENSFDLEYNYGYQLMLRGDFDRGLLHVERAMVLSPNYTVPYAIAGSIHLKKGDYEKAVYYYNESLFRDPENYAALYGLMHAKLMLAEYEEAEKIGMIALRIFPKDTFLHTLLAITKYNLGSKQEALKMTYRSFLANHAAFHRLVYFNMLREKNLDYRQFIPYN